MGNTQDTFDTPQEEEMTFSKKIKMKSSKIVEDSKHGETKQKIKKCKKSLDAVGAGDFSFKLHFDSAKVEIVIFYSNILP